MVFAVWRRPWRTYAATDPETRRRIVARDCLVVRLAYAHRVGCGRCLVRNEPPPFVKAEAAPGLGAVADGQNLDVRRDYLLRGREILTQLKNEGCLLPTGTGSRFDGQLAELPDAG